MRYNQPMARSLYPSYRYLFDSLRRSRSLARRLFGVSCPARSTYFFWDQVTLGLRRVLLGEPLEGLSVCDMGCGPVAALFLGELLVRKRNGRAGAASSRMASSGPAV